MIFPVRVIDVAYGMEQAICAHCCFFVEGINSISVHFLMPDFDYSYCSFFVVGGYKCFIALLSPHHNVSLCWINKFVCVNNPFLISADTNKNDLE